MAAITNTTLKKHFTKIAGVLNARNENLNAEAVASALVLTILEEGGCTDLLDASEESKAFRTEMVTLVKPFLTAVNNVQNSIISQTHGEDGKPLMPKVVGKAALVKAEFI